MAFHQFSCTASTQVPAKVTADDGRWQQLKDVIHQLYIADGMTLEALIPHMTKQYGFCATRAQYTTKFNNWGWQKNNKRKYYEDIDRSLKRRRLSLADADISIKGTRCSVKKLKKEIARYADKDVHSNITVDPESITTPTDVIIQPIKAQRTELTPSSKIRKIEVNLPWHEFIEEFASASFAISSTSRLKPCTFPVHDLYGAPLPTSLVSFTHNEFRKQARLPAPLLEPIQQSLNAFLMRRKPHSVSEAAKELVDPTSKITIGKLVSYFVFIASNDLGLNRQLRRCLSEMKAYQFSNFRFIFNQGSPSAGAAARRLLHDAIALGEANFITEALQAGVDIESPSVGGDEGMSLTLLQSALWHGKRDIAEMLLKFGADVNAPSGIDIRRPFSSCEKPHARGFTCVCQRTGDLSPIALAARNPRFVNLIPKLLAQQATIPDCNVLLAAIKYGASMATVRALLDHGEDPDQCGYVPDSCQSLIAEMPSCQSLIAERASTPLNAAAGRLDADIVKLLLSRGANPNGPLRAEFSHLYTYYRRQGWSSPLMSATIGELPQPDSNQLAVMHLLLLHGADPNLSTLEFLDSSVGLDEFADPDDLELGDTLLLYPLQGAVDLGDLQIASKLLESGASVNTRYGTPALTIAVKNRRFELVMMLLHARADPNALGLHRCCSSALVAAVQNRDLKTVDVLLEFGADINKCPSLEGGRTPLQSAAENGEIAIVEHLLRRGACMLSEIAPIGGISVLQGFVENSNYKYVSLALEAGVDPNQRSEEGRTPLNAAVVNGDVVTLRKLILAGANIHEYSPVIWVDDDSSESSDSMDSFKPCGEFDPDQMLSPIQWASYTNNVQVARILRDAGANVDQKPCSDSGDMALHLAAQRRHRAMVRFLLKEGAAVNVWSNETTALSVSIDSGHLDICKYLLRSGANPNLEDISQPRRDVPWTPLERACYEGNFAMVDALIRAGAEPGLGNPLRFAMRNYHTLNSMTAIVELLFIHGVDINQREENFHTPLQAAVVTEKDQFVYRLVEKGADINAKPSQGERGRTALQAAVSNRNMTLVKFLMDKGADVNAPAAGNNGVTALQAAAISGNLSLAEILLQHGADIDAAPSKIAGRKAIEGAAEFGRLDMVKLLLDNYHGSSHDLAKQIQTALSAAQRKNQWHVMQMLESYKAPNDTLFPQSTDVGREDVLWDNGAPDNDLWLEEFDMS